MTGLVLDVGASMLGRPWRARLDAGAMRRAEAIGQVHGTPDLLARVLASRGVAIEAVEGFLAPTLRSLMPDPDGMRDMGAAVARLGAAIRTGEAVAVLGDYDVDGAASAALMADYLRTAGLTCRIHIPDRLLEGYGPNVAAVRAIAEAGATLLVTTDCGSTSHEALAEAARLGLDTVVIDHHQVGSDLPAAWAVVNPNRPDDLSGLGHLCAAGVVFMVLVALHRALRQAGFWTGREAPDLLAGLDLVALATVADVVPLVGLNRAFVAKGLAVLRGRGRPGLAALLDVARANGPPSTFHLGFLIGPRINAGGRIGNAALGTELLLARDPIEARRIADELDRLNQDRRAIEAEALEVAQAEAMAALEAREDSAVILVAAEGWHPGVMGLVAARLRERFGRPAFAVALSGGVGTGSGRSIAGADLGKAVRTAVQAGLLRRGGGHAMAAGITVEAAALPALRSFLEAHFGPDIDRLRGADALEVDGVLSASGLTVDLAAAIEPAGPFGAGSPAPVVALAEVRVTDLAPVGADHLRLTLAGRDGSAVRAIAFRAARTALATQLTQARGGLVHAACTIALDRRGGGEPRVQLQLLDAALAGDARAR